MVLTHSSQRGEGGSQAWVSPCKAWSADTARGETGEEQEVKSDGETDRTTRCKKKERKKQRKKKQRGMLGK